MFGMGGSEILVILIVALLFLGPDKLPDAAKKISKGIRDIKQQSRVLQQTIEDDEHIGGAIRDLKSALRGEEVPNRPKPLKPKKKKRLPELAPGDVVIGPAPKIEELPAAPVAPVETWACDVPAETAAVTAAPVEAAPKLTLPPTAGEADPGVEVATDHDELAALIKPADGTVAKGSEPKHG